MVIKPISSSNVYYQKQKSGKASFNDKNNQSITLKANSKINLGKINGKEFNMKINPTSGYQWSGASPIKLTNSSVVTANDAAAAYAVQQYTREEYDECAEITGTINLLYLTVDRGWTAEQFNEICGQTNISQSDVESALSRLGLDYSKPFNINGRTFVYEFGTIKDYKEE